MKQTNIFGMSNGLLVLLQLVFILLLTTSYPLMAQQGDSPERSLVGFEPAGVAQPLWEFGAAGVFLDVPNYPASSERNSTALVLPYFIYRGDVFRFGDGEARAVVVEDKDFEFGFSVGGALAADSEDNTAREGMTELDFLFEIGPQLTYRLRDFDFDGSSDGRLNLRLQARTVFSTDFERINHRGYIFQPKFSYQQRGVITEQTAFNASFSLLFATEKLHDYFYEVDEVFANSSRPAYDASGGFLSAEIAFGFSFPMHNNVRGFLGGTIKVHQGAANKASPLFEDDITYSVGIGFVWRLHKSDRNASL